MKKPVHYFQRTFRQDIFFFIGWSRKELESYCKKKLKVEVDVSDCFGSCIVVSYYHRDPIIIVWNYSKKRTDITVHESVHVANKILKMIGNIPSHHNDEVIAYLTQEIFLASKQKNS